jgi:hypothetical protein
MRTLEQALPRYEIGADRALLWLLHETDPPRPVSGQSGYSQEGLVSQIRALESVHPSPVLRTYLDRWEHQLIALCTNPQQRCQFPHGS